MAKTIIKNGTIVTASDEYEADILIEDEKITTIGENLQETDAETVDASGQYIFPGGVDPHTHLEMPFGGTVSRDDFESGSIAAAFGGTTSVIDFCLTSKDKPLSSSIQEWHDKSEGRSVIDYGFHLMITQMNEDVLDQLPSIIQNDGITSFKVFMAYKNVFQADDETLYRTLLAAKELGALVMVHAENGDVIQHLTEEALAAGNTEPIYHARTRPSEIEGEATGRAARFTGLADSQLYVVHVSCADAAEEIRKARRKGANVWGETCPQYLVLDESYMDQPGFEGAKYVWSPPLREKWNQEELWTAIKNGDLSTIGSDQCSFDFNGQKDLGKDDFTKIPNGGPMIEDRMSILYSEGVAKGRISRQQFVDITSTKSAKLFGLYPDKGTIAVGADADLVLFNPDESRTISAKTQHMAVDYNAFEGMEVQGVIESTMVRGRFVVRDRKLEAEPGYGKYMKRKPFALGSSSKTAASTTSV